MSQNAKPNLPTAVDSSLAIRTFPDRKAWRGACNYWRRANKALIGQFCDTALSELFVDVYQDVKALLTFTPARHTGSYDKGFLKKTRATAETENSRAAVTEILRFSKCSSRDIFPLEHCVCGINDSSAVAERNR